MSRIQSLLLAALIGSATDTWWTRARYAHRDGDPALFLQSFLLWLCYCLLALLPVVLLVALWNRFSGSSTEATALDSGVESSETPGGNYRRGLREFLVLMLFVGGVVLAHGVLDRYTGLGGNVSALKSWKPWAALGGQALIGVALVFGIDRFLGQRNLRVVGVVLAGLAITLGCVATFRGADGAGAVSPTAEAPVAQASEEHPNVLFLVWDTTRAQSLNLYGYDRSTTPYLADLASESLVFENARSSSVFTLSSHISMLTGTYASEHQASLTRQRYDPRQNPSVARLLSEAGYRTGAFVGTDVLRADTAVIDGFETFDDQTDPWVTYTRAWGLLHDVQSVLAGAVPALYFNGRPHWIQDFQRPADPVLDRALDWINNGDSRPWFCFVNLYDVHWPYLPTEKFNKWGLDDHYDGPVDGFLFRNTDIGHGYALNDQDKSHLRDLYDGELSQLDDVVERFLVQVQDRTDPVALMLTSDHGEAFGEAERYEHFDIIEPQVRVPMLIKPARQISALPGVYETPVSGVDVAPTLMAMAGVPVRMRSAGAASAPGEAAIAGRDSLHVGEDLQSLAAKPKRMNRQILVEDRDKFDSADFRIALYEGPWKLVRNGVGDEAEWQLFNMDEDPLDESNLLEQEPQLVQRLQAAFLDLRDSWGAVDEVGPGAGNQDALKGLGYMDSAAEDEE